MAHLPRRCAPPALIPDFSCPFNTRVAHLWTAFSPLPFPSKARSSRAPTLSSRCISKLAALKIPAPPWTLSAALSTSFRNTPTLPGGNKRFDQYRLAFSLAALRQPCRQADGKTLRRQTKARFHLAITNRQRVVKL